MEVEWENASAMKVNDDDDRVWGSLPEYAWPAVGDRVWVEGRWIFDCGHTGASGLSSVRNIVNVNNYVKYDSEIHPPRAVVAFRLNHTALASEPYRAGSVMPSSWLPVTGEAVAALPPPTLVPVTEADIFVSGNGGGANDKCMLMKDCGDSDHTGPLVAINNVNYVFDIYPPGTKYDSFEANGTFKVLPPIADASLQYRIVDQSGELPLHTCGRDLSYCLTVQPTICLLGASTPPTPSDPTQQTNLGTACPTLMPGEQPTRLRVILPFAGSYANYFAKSILLGWDDVPDPAGHATPVVHTLKVTLKQFTVDQDGRCCTNADWRVFVNVGGQGRYISPFFDTNHGIFHFNGGDNLCHGDPLDDVGDGDCYRFNGTPWYVNVADNTPVDVTPIHIHVGGFDSSGVDGNFCRTYDLSDCSPGIHGYFDLAFENDNRVGTHEFNLLPTGYAPPLPNPFQIPETKEEYKYTHDFSVEEVPTPTPSTATLQIGDPHYANFVASATPFALSSSDSRLQDFQYRFHQQGGPLPTYSSGLGFPIHWTSASASASQSVAVYLNGASNLGDGAYDFQYSAQNVGNQLEPRHSQTVTLDNTPPVVTINQPAATQYTHADTLTIDYNANDGIGSGVKSSTAKMDGSTTLPSGTVVTNGLKISLFSQLTLGAHTFSVDAADYLNNTGTKTVAFSIIVTADSLEQDVNILLGLGCIDNSGIGNSLVSKLDAVKSRIAAGDTHSAINTLTALLNQAQAQAGKHISTACIDPNSHTQFNAAQLFIGDVEALLASLKTTGLTDPILGYVLSGNNSVGGATVTLLNAGNGVVATTTADATGFYFFAQTNTLIAGGSYTATVTAIPKPYTTSTPTSQTFTWSAMQVNLNPFLLN
jgi:hypothetical protein